MSWDKKYTNDVHSMFIPASVKEQLADEKKKTECAKKNKMKEATVAGAIAGIPSPMNVGTVPGTEAAVLEYEVAGGGSDGHTHTAYVDAYGHGYTMGSEHHEHSIAGFMIAPYMDPYTMETHEHPAIEQEDRDDVTYYPTPEDSDGVM